MPFWGSELFRSPLQKHGVSISLSLVRQKWSEQISKQKNEKKKTPWLPGSNGSNWTFNRWLLGFVWGTEWESLQEQGPHVQRTIRCCKWGNNMKKKVKPYSTRSVIATYSDNLPKLDEQHTKKKWQYWLNQTFFKVLLSDSGLRSRPSNMVTVQSPSTSLKGAEVTGFPDGNQVNWINIPSLFEVKP